MSTKPIIPISSPAECLGTAARIIDRSITSIYDDALRPHGLRITQMALLVVLYKKGEGTATELASMLCFEKSTLSRSIERLIDNGWVAVGEAVDSRVQPLRLTPAGERLLARAMPAWNDAQDEARVTLGKSGASALTKSARSLVNGSLSAT